MSEQFLAMTIASIGLPEAITSLELADTELRDMRNLAGQFVQLLDAGKTDLAAATPFDTGKMIAAWRIEGDTSGAYEFRGKIVNDMFYAPYVLEGTGEYGPSDKGSGQIIVAKGKPFVFFSKKFQRKRVLWRHRGQPANAQLNETMDGMGSFLLRAAGRVLRGQIQAIFERQTQPGIIVQGG